MNIKITEEQRSELWSRKVQDGVIFGSQLYGTATESSDTDILYFYQDFPNNGIPHKHCFQFRKGKIDEIWVGRQQFWHLLNEGDNSIFVEYILFSSNLLDSLAICRTFKIIRGLLGLSKRDIRAFTKYKEEKRLKHAVRCLFIAEKLLKGEYPTLTGIKSIIELSEDKTLYNDLTTYSELVSKNLEPTYEKLRFELNRQYENYTLKKYFIPIVDNSVHQLLLNSNNLINFYND